MKTYVTLIFLLLTTESSFAQTNTFPSSGNVGIGTTGPATKLHVVSNTGSPGDFNGYPGYTISSVWPKAIVPETIFEHPNSGTSIGNQYTYRGGIGLGHGVGIYSINPNPAGSLYYGDIRFHNTYWNGSSYTNADRMVIDVYGNVGIGTTTPASRLSVDGGDLQVESGQGRFKGWYNAGTGLGMEIGVSGGNGQILTYDRTAQVYASTSIQSNNALFTVSNNNKFLFSGGNVGIGTSDPGYKLHIETDATSGLLLRTHNSTVGNPQVDYYDYVRGSETVVSSTDGTNTGTFIGSYSNHPLLLGANAGSGENITKRMIQPNGSVGIGTSNPGPYKLAVEGTIGARKFKVTQVTPWADYVFDPSYELKSLSQVEAFIKINKRLPDVPSEKEVKENGIDVGDNQALLLKKIEELTLYLIEQQKRIEVLEKQVKQK